MAKSKYVENICCKIFRKFFNMHDIVKELDLGKTDQMTKKFASYKVKNDNFPGCNKMRTLLSEVVETLIHTNEKDFLDKVYDEDPLLELRLKDLDFETLMNKLFEVDKHESNKQKFIHISME